MGYVSLEDDIVADSDNLGDVYSDVQVGPGALDSVTVGSIPAGGRHWCVDSGGRSQHCTQGKTSVIGEVRHVDGVGHGEAHIQSTLAADG